MICERTSSVKTRFLIVLALAMLLATACGPQMATPTPEGNIVNTSEVATAVVEEVVTPAATEEATAAAQEKIDEEKENRDDTNAVELDSSFIAYMQSVDTSYFPAIEGQYQYDQTYNYDSLIADYHDQQLRIGVN